jgi:GNAT superfamily N-acetyltransferase
VPDASIARPDDADAVADVLAAAFAEDPMLRWVFSDPQHGPAHLRAFFRVGVGVGVGVRQGHVHVLRDGETVVAAAVWAPPGLAAYDQVSGELIGHLLTGAETARLGMIQEGFGHLRDYRPEEPHFYLSLLGVDPARRGEGLGGRLLAASLEVVDHFGDPAYLESSNPRNVSLYERHGVAVEAAIQMPDGPILRPMWRPSTR